MITQKLQLILLPHVYAVCRIDKYAPLPIWASSGEFVAIARTADELSVVCSQSLVPEGVLCEKDWRCLRVAGTMEFSMIGIVASLVSPLAEAGVSVFVISTFDTDYLLVKVNDLDKALAALRHAGHEVA